MDVDKAYPTDKKDIWANYDPEEALRALQELRGIFKGIDVEQLKKDLKKPGASATGALDASRASAGPPHRC
jgi:hypothetical protein